MALIPPTTTSNIGFGFGSTNFPYYPDRVWHGEFFTNFHGGIDYWGPLGYPIWAAGTGYVLHAGFAVPFIGFAGGNGVVIQHGANMLTVYGHMNAVAVSAGQQVQQGQRIGTMGQSGIANGVVHLHFDVWTTTAQWGFDVDDPNVYFLTGTGASSFEYGQSRDDIPAVEPLHGTKMLMARCNPIGDGDYSPPTVATTVGAVYFDKILASPSHYSLVNKGWTKHIRPLTSLNSEVEVYCDYIV